MANAMLWSYLKLLVPFFSARVLQKIPTVTAGVGTRAEVSRIVDGGDSTN